MAIPRRGLGLVVLIALGYLVDVPFSRPGGDAVKAERAMMRAAAAAAAMTLNEWPSLYPSSELATEESTVREVDLEGGAVPQMHSETGSEVAIGIHETEKNHGTNAKARAVVAHPVVAALNRTINRAVISCHKCGSVMTGQMVARTCNLLFNNTDTPFQKCFTWPMFMHPTIAPSPGCSEEYSGCFPKKGKNEDTSCCPFHYPAPFEPSPWSHGLSRVIAFIRDPIHIVVSQCWYEFDGQEHGKKGGSGNVTYDLERQLVQGGHRVYVAVAQINQLIRRNDPRNYKTACLEDLMESEFAFIDLWGKAFAHWGMSVSSAQLQEELALAEMNPRSPMAAEGTLGHAASSREGREALSLKYAQEIMEIEKVVPVQVPSSQGSDQENVLYGKAGNLLGLSKNVKCWDWHQNSRGEKDEWVLQ